MLAVMFKAAGQRYVVPAKAVEEVTALVSLSPLPGAPAYIRGIMNYRGAPLPVADLGVLLADRPSRPWGSTRILIHGFTAAPGGPVGRVGLMAERAMRTVSIPDDAFCPPKSPAAAFITAVAVTEHGLVERIDPLLLLPEELLQSLFTAGAPA